MIEQLRTHLEQLGEPFIEKNAAFKIKVIPVFCAISIKKDHKNEGKLTFYSNQLVEILLICLFLLFGLAIFNPQEGLTQGPIQLAISALMSLNLLIKQIAIESLKTRLFHCHIMNNQVVENEKKSAEIH
ncbi:hypothetical protein [Pseudoalteromonas ulvae]|uniref:Uncharacterized protein n=1 Tax=Pseudoalteromonas ulvae TaxID=107327 RepID=A0A244CT25_PSEDV|nr:hypothetical protein [Pseudoalteromonas ulvae]OUL58753.1 hypothetical protein B1199_00230 [Pseudoalteromonas ulvae]